MTKKERPRKSILIINRWDDDFAKYETHIDHTINDIYYITTEVGLKGIASNLAKAVRVVQTLSDYDTVLAKIAELATIVSSFDKVFALSEYDIELGAHIRSHFGIPGTTIAQAHIYKDKVAMKTAMISQNVRAPKHLHTENINQIIEFARDVGFPIILKPCVGAASNGVQKIQSETQLLECISDISLKDYQCEEYISGSVLHVDGIITKNKLFVIQASKYIGTCLEFNTGKPLGSVFIDDEILHARIEDFTKDVLQALELSTGAFHLEIFLTDDDELVFLEIGARVGGAEVGFVMREVLGFDLISLWLKLEMDELVFNTNKRNKTMVGGWLLIPVPSVIPCRVAAVKSLMGKVDGLYHEILPTTGQILDGKGGYEVISGRFRFEGKSTEVVESSIRRAICLFDIQYTPMMEVLGEFIDV
jgi:ATP-grasp domain